MVAEVTMEHTRPPGLPDERTSFVGRREELAALRAAISQHRLVTVTGAPGGGKSRLVVHHLRGLRRLPDLDVRYLSGRGTAGFDLSSMGTCGLLVVDDADDIPDLRRTIDALLRDDSGVRIIVTRQQRLGLHGEAIIPVPPLATPRRLVGVTLGAYAREPAVSLVIDRAAAAAPGFALTEATLPDIHELCILADGLPRALEIAAERLRALSAAQVRTLFTVPSLVPVAGLDEERDGSHGLRASITDAYRRCPPEFREFWRAVAVLDGTLGIPLLAHVAAVPPALAMDLATGLVDRSLLEVVRFDDEVRYRMLHPLRLHGIAEATEDGSIGELQDRALAALAATADAAGRELFSENQAHWFDRIGRDQATIIGALQRRLRDPAGDPEPPFLILSDLRMFWIAQSESPSALRLLAQALEREGGSPCGRRRAFWTQAYLAVFAGATDLARRAIESARDLAPDDIDLHYLEALLALEDGALDLAWTRIRSALTSALDHDASTKEPVVGEVFYYAALIALVRGDTSGLADLESVSLALISSDDDSWGHAYLSCIAALGAWQRREHALAKARIVDALRVFEALHDRAGMALGLEITAWIEADRGHLDRAARLLGTVESENPLGLTMLRGYRDRFAARARASLGADSFDTHLARGRSTSVESAVASALGSDQQSLAPASSVAPSALSRRELEIAALIAAGFPNPRIAAQLVISRRTVEGHVQRILAKLDFASRTQIAAWYVTYVDPAAAPQGVIAQPNR